MPKAPKTAWKKGQSGNPDGKRLTTALRQSLNDWETDGHGDPITDENGNKVKRLRRVADALVKKAMNGDVTAIAECFNRLDGKVPNVNVEVPIKGAEEMTRDELIAFLAGEYADRGSEDDSSLSRAKPAGSA